MKNPNQAISDIKESTYEVVYTCDNCGHKDLKYLPKGYPISKGVVCVYCGCVTRDARKTTPKDWK